MSDNFSEETKPLFKLLRIEAFRFVLVHFNHYSLLNRLKDDLRQRYASRGIAEVDANEVSYREITDEYYKLESGLFLINNFESVLSDAEKYIGLNLRRDKLAKYPIAMICFISPGSQELSARDIMEKMPDLWSFRSLLLDLKTDIASDAFTGSGRIETANLQRNISSLGGYSSSDKLNELARLERLVAETSPEEKALLETLYRQIKDIQQDIGLYKEAITTINTLKNFAIDEEDIGLLLLDEGDFLETTGESVKALDVFVAAKELFEKLSKIHSQNEAYQNNLAVSFERLGNVHTSLGDLEEALACYKDETKLFKELNYANPQNVDFKNGLAISFSKLGGTLVSLGDLNQALFHFEQYNQLIKELYEVYPKNISFKNGLAISYLRLGDTQSALGNFEKALAFYEDRLRLVKELYEVNIQNVSFQNGLAISYSRLGDIQLSLNNFKQALSYYESNYQFMKELYETYKQNISFKRGLAISYSRLGDIQFALGNFDEALSYFKRCSQISKELYEAYPLNVSLKNGLAVSYFSLGSFYQKIHDQEKALSYFHLVRDLWQSLNKKHPANAEFKKNYNEVIDVLKELEDTSA